jgi:hypothetical protein
VLANEAGEHLPHFGYDSIQIEHTRLQDLHAAEGEQLPGHGDGAAGGFLNLLDAAALQGVSAGPVGEDVGVAANDGKQIIKIMGDATREPTHGLHLMGLAQALLKLPLLTLRFLESGTHARKRAGNFRHFVAAETLQRILIVALLERSNAGDQVRERARKGMGDKKDERSAGQHTEQSEADQNMIQADEKGGGLIERLQDRKLDASGCVA